MFPWTVFGKITLRMRPAVEVVHVWAATQLSNEIEGEERVVTVELGHKSQDDFTFAIDGTGGPIKHTSLSCSNTEVKQSACGLQPTFTILNNYNGIISPKVYLETWQVGATVELTFKEPLSIGQIWGAEQVGIDDEDADVEGVTVSQAGGELADLSSSRTSGRATLPLRFSSFVQGSSQTEPSCMERLDCLPGRAGPAARNLVVV